MIHSSCLTQLLLLCCISFPGFEAPNAEVERIPPKGEITNRLLQFQKANIRVIFGRKECGDVEKLLTYSQFGPATLATVLSSLDIELDTTHVPSQLIFDENNVDDFISIKSLLNSEGETQCQEQLSSLCHHPYSGLIDAHNGAFYSPSKSQSLTQNMNEVVATPLNGKIDLCSKHGPLFLEVRGRVASSGQLITNLELELLDQVLGRMFRLRGTYGQIKTAVGFASTSTIAWCFVFQTDQNFVDSMKIWRVSHKDIFAIWSSVTGKFLSDPIGWMLTTDAPFLNNCLMHLGWHPSLCSVRIIRESRSSHHRVYRVFLPRSCSYSSAKRPTSVTAWPNERPDFCLKVHDDGRTMSSFQRESEAIAAIISSSGSTPANDGDFYAYGSMPFQSSLPEFCEISVTGNGRNSLDSRSVDISQAVHARTISSIRHEACLVGKDVWNIFPSHLPTMTGGVILMQAGRLQVINHENIAIVLEGVKKSLSQVHTAGYCHCDIRASNILQFDLGGYQLIDFDMATPIDGVLTFTKGAQFDNRGYRLRNAVLQEEVRWGVSDDYQMLIELVQKTTITTQSKSTPSTPPHSRSAFAMIDGCG
jgi:serine/threonine protein kinase